MTDEDRQEPQSDDRQPSRPEDEVDVQLPPVVSAEDTGRPTDALEPANPTSIDLEPVGTEESPEPTNGGDDWFWWTDGGQHRPVSDVPARPDLPGMIPARSPATWLDDRESWAWSPPPPGRHARRSRATSVLAAFVAAAVLIASGIGIGWGLSQGDSGGSSGSQAIGNQPPADGGNQGPGGGTDNGPAGSNTQALADYVSPAVVVIETELGTGVPGTGAVGAASGTGMILSSSGEILTNNHVIRGATKIEVTVEGRGTYEAEVVGADPTDDVALLQLTDVSGLPTISTDTSDLSVGQTVVAVGNAYGQGESSATTGSITGLDQSITAGDPGSEPEHLTGLIETNAPIAPGDSGGALVDGDGEVIGMITAASRTSAITRTSTEGYAIGIGDALDIVDRIHTGVATGDIILGVPGLMGVQVRDLDQSSAARLGINPDDGALVLQVVPGAPAAGAGMRSGSAITTINGNPIRSADDLTEVMHQTKPGQQATVSWVDVDGLHTETMELITAPAV